MPSTNHAFMNDMLGREVLLPKKPQRIICLVPSISELLYALHLGQRVVGITKFCVHPTEWRKSKAIVGGTKKVDLKRIELLQPDLIIANKEENTIEDIEQLAKHYPVWVSDINSFDDALHAIERLGELTQSEKRSKYLNFSIHKAWSRVPLHSYPYKTCAYLIWNDPIMVVGRNTYINSILEKNHLKNCIKKERYPELSIEDLQANKPDIVFLSSEPYPFKQKHVKALSKLLPDSKIMLVDGEMFSWYGSRMIAAADYFKSLLAEIHNK
jgi:ABC-type Fe3+-hydroxamate transport system substrate-binding protein